LGFEREAVGTRKERLGGNPWELTTTPTEISNEQLADKHSTEWEGGESDWG
jgi:hypothetical protein